MRIRCTYASIEHVIVYVVGTIQRLIRTGPILVPGDFEGAPTATIGAIGIEGGLTALLTYARRFEASTRAPAGVLGRERQMESIAAERAGVAGQVERLVRAPRAGVGQAERRRAAGGASGTEARRRRRTRVPVRVRLRVGLGARRRRRRGRRRGARALPRERRRRRRLLHDQLHLRTGGLSRHHIETRWPGALGPLVTLGIKKSTLFSFTSACALEEFRVRFPVGSI